MKEQLFYVRFKLNDFDSNYLYYSKHFNNYDFAHFEKNDTDKVFLFTYKKLEELGFIDNAIFDVYQFETE